MSSITLTCSVEGCERPHSAKSYCSWHYQRSRLGVEMNRPYGPLKVHGDTCTHGDCSRPHTASGLCTMHYKRKSKGSDMDAPHISEIKRAIIKPKRTTAPRVPAICLNPHCDKIATGRGLCPGHYSRYYAGVNSETPILDNKRYEGRKCFITGCPNSAGGRIGLCKSHGNWAGKYGLSVLQAIQILNSGYTCDICDTEIGRFSINVDHDHSCCPGQGTCGNCIRGLLCRACNRAIGSFSEDRENIRKALSYLGG